MCRFHLFVFHVKNIVSVLIMYFFTYHKEQFFEARKLSFFFLLFLPPSIINDQELIFYKLLKV